jgi:predicted RNase H-like HicB family nuclease
LLPLLKNGETIENAKDNLKEAVEPIWEDHWGGHTPWFV